MCVYIYIEREREHVCDAPLYSISGVKGVCFEWNYKNTYNIWDSTNTKNTWAIKCQQK